MAAFARGTCGVVETVELAGVPFQVTDGPRATILVHPDDVLGCGAEIATEQSDCWVSRHDLRLRPGAVIGVVVGSCPRSRDREEVL
ncbi:hypothetical protein [Lentzea sp. NPDC004782]|uniref:hypothetical protein n=1 Tax=Lentzea sp. NPDC004782 TaxID=3154458 RepID=UPI0033AD7290